MKTQQELCDILGFIAEYATYQLGSGVHTSRAVRTPDRRSAGRGRSVVEFPKEYDTDCARPRERRVRNPCGGNPVAPHQSSGTLI